MDSSRSDPIYSPPISMKVPKSHGTFRPMRPGGNDVGDLACMNGLRVSENLILSE